MEPIIDLYVILSLMTLTLAGFYAIFLFYHSRVDLTNLFLGIIVVIIGFNLYHDALVHSRLLIQYPQVWGFGGAVSPFLFVLAYLLFKNYSFGSLKQLDWLHLTVPIAYFSYRLIDRVSHDYNINELINYYQVRPLQQFEFNLVYGVNFSITILFAASYLFLSYRLIYKNWNTFGHGWTKTIIVFPTIEFIFGVFIFSKIIFGLNYDEWLVSLTLTFVQVLFLGGLVVQYPVHTKSNSKIPKYDSSNLSENQITQYVGQIEAVIQSKGLYKKADFSLKELSSLTGINSSYLSQCINSRLETNFTDYVNSFRVDLAKQLLADPLFDKFKIEAIAFEAGFNSKSSYYRAFQKVTGQTPAQYKKSLLVK